MEIRTSSLLRGLRCFAHKVVVGLSFVGYVRGFQLLFIPCFLKVENKNHFGEHHSCCTLLEGNESSTTINSMGTQEKKRCEVHHHQSPDSDSRRAGYFRKSRKKKRNKKISAFVKLVQKSHPTTTVLTLFFSC